MSPKSLLRHPRAVSPVDELVSNRFHEVLDDPAPPSQPRRLALCSGKVYYDLLDGRDAKGIDDVAIVRVEQLYPFNGTLFRRVIEPYLGAQSVVWVQEETRNRGPWSYMLPILQEHFPGREISYVGREPSASPATGSLRVHRKQQSAVVAKALGGSR
jgi:2-oxoglutarate dehydrogenase E1 component